MKRKYFSLYEFVFLTFKNFYYKDDIDECYRHTLVMFMIILVFPFVGLLFSLGVDISPCENCSVLINKVLLVPFGFVILFIVYRLVKKWGFYDSKHELKKKSFSNFSYSYKLKMFSIIFLMITSIIWLPILIFEIFGNG